MDMSDIKSDKYLWKFLVIAGLALLTDFIFENINHRFWLNDFKVYYSAAGALWNGTTVYGEAFGLSSGFYKYSPATLIFFIPHCLLPYSIASILHFFSLAVVMIYVPFVIRDILRDHYFARWIRQENLLFILAFICVLLHFVKELHLGNITVVLLLLLSLSLRSLLRSQPVRAGILFGIVVLAKPFFLILILPLIFRKQWKALGGFAVTLVVTSLLPALLVGLNRDIQLHFEWYRAVFDHNANYPSHNSLMYMIQYYFDPGVPGFVQYLIIAAGALAYTALYYFNRKREREAMDNTLVSRASMTAEWFFLIAILPDLVKTDSEHFLSTLPVIMVLLVFLIQRKQWLPSILFVVLIFFYGGNSTDLLGRDLSDFLFERALIGISNLLLIVYFLIVHFHYRPGTSKQV